VVEKLLAAGANKNAKDKVNGGWGAGVEDTEGSLSHRIVEPKFLSLLLTSSPKPEIPTPEELFCHNL